MVYVIIILGLFLTLSIATNFYQHELICEERNRRFEAEAWIDPISWEETK